MIVFRKSNKPNRKTTQKSSNVNVNRTNAKQNSGTTKKAGSMTWYHGTTVKEVKSINDLNTEFSSDYGDFGKGVYLTLEKKLAGKLIPGGHPFEAVWCNDSLDVVCGKLKSGEEWFEGVVTGPKGEQYKILILTKAGKKWKQVMFDGWVKGKQQEEYDMVLGPVSAGNANSWGRSVRDKKKTVADFMSAIKPLPGYPGLAFELCVYKDEIIKKCFVKM